MFDDQPCTVLVSSGNGSFEYKIIKTGPDNGKKIKARYFAA